MSDSKNDFIDQLSQKLVPVKVLPRPLQRAMLWFPLLLFGVMAISVLLDDYRAGFAAQIVAYGRFQIELIAALVLSFVTLYISFSRVIPGAPVNQTITWFVRMTALLLASSLIWSLIDASPAASTQGVRAYCELEVTVYGLLLVVFFSLKNRHGYFAGGMGQRMQLGVSLGLIPAFLMQLGCMYDPLHGLVFHYLPVLLVALLAMVLVRVLSRSGVNSQ